MSRVLYIKASPRGGRSKSIAVADAFIAEYKKHHPDDEIEVFDLFEADLPSFDGLTVQAKYTIMHGKEHTDAELKAWRRVEELIEHFKSADKYVLAVPMWNFGISYRLKQYIDILVQPGYAFTYSPEEGYKGLITGRPLFVAYARGGAYGEGTGSDALDYQKKYIEVIFPFMGFTDIRPVVVEPTLQGGEATAKQVLEQGIDRARQLAPAF
ncbi:MAG: NAD(P)H-dependent oxidoreductase [Phycisphaerae bacterium]|nr:NAD(P)H-dependent oxidoreductase [Phycisphaerae bacterium]